MLHDRLTGAPRGATGDEGAANAHITRAMVAALTSVATQIKTLDAQIAEQLSLHADAHIFTSCPAPAPSAPPGCSPRSGTAEPVSHARIVGLPGWRRPSTRQSGKVKHVGFRWAADKQLRDAVCDFASDSRRANLWAADRYNRAIARGHDHPHAVRILARAWLYAIWHCWQDGAAYHPANHRALQALLNQDQDRAA